MQDNRVRIAVLSGLLLIATWVYFPWPEQVPGAPKFPVSGKVMVNGTPAAGLTVRMYHTDTSLMSQDQVPVGMTDEDGVFELSSFGGNDGAAAGEYRVTLFWPQNFMQPGTDRFQGYYNDPARSEFQATITPETSQLPPIEVEFPEEDLLPLHFGLQDMKAAAAAAQN